MGDIYVSLKDMSALSVLELTWTAYRFPTLGIPRHYFLPSITITGSFP